MSEFGEHTLGTSAPDDWKVVPLGDALERVVGGGTPARANPAYWTGSIPWLTVKDMRTHRPADSIDHISEVAVENSSTNIIPADTVIIATRIGLGKVIRVPFPAAINQDLKALIPKEGIDKNYLEYWIYSIASYLESIGSGTTVKGIRLEQLKSLPFPIAPLDQQQRIVAEIEKQFSRLDEAVTSLKRVKANLKRYKAAVLKAAVEGKLTEEWRNQNPGVEPASKLLERILTERRTKWEEAELAKMKAKGKEPKDDKWKEKYIEPDVMNASTLSELPDSWVLARLDQIAEIKGGITKDSKRKATDFETLPYLRVANVQRGWIDIEKMKEIDVPAEKVEALLLRPGDILFNEGGDRDKLGRGWVWEGQIERCIYQNHVFRARLYSLNTFEPKLISWYGNGFGQKYFMSKGKQTTNLASINKTLLSSLPIPVPPIDEQSAIREKVDMEMVRLSVLEKSADKNMSRANGLRQSILAQAFRGELTGMGYVRREA